MHKRTSQPETQYFRALDGIRAICIVLTLLAHTPDAPSWINGVLGVDVFFALSGFLITTLLCQERNRSGGVCVKCFYVRRAFRIIPVYFLTIALYGSLAFLLYYFKGVEQNWTEFRYAFKYLVTFNSEYRSVEAGKIFGHAWTLGIEEKYYIAWPLIFVLAFRAPRLTAFGLLLFLVLIVGYGGKFEVRGYVGLLAGSAFAFALARSHLVRDVFDSIPNWVIFGVFLVAFIYCSSGVPPYHYVLVSIAGTPLIANLCRRASNIRSVLSLPAMTFVGGLTYTIYLTHRLVGHFWEAIIERLSIRPEWYLHFVLVYSSSIVVAYFIYIVVERPLTTFGRRLASSLRVR